MSYNLRRGRNIRHTSPGTDRVLEEGRWKDNVVDHVILPSAHVIPTLTFAVLLSCPKLYSSLLPTTFAKFETV